MRSKVNHCAAPSSAMISTAMAVEMTPSPRSPRRRVVRWVVVVIGVLLGVGDLGGAEDAQRLEERDGDEDGAGDEGGDRDGDTDLLAAPLDLLDQLQLDLDRKSTRQNSSQQCTS